MTTSSDPFDEILGLMASDFAAAEGRMHDMVRAEPDSFDVHFMFGFIHSRRQDYAAAAISLAWAVEIWPSDLVALFNLGYCRQQLGEGTEALVHYRAALRASGGGYGDAAVLVGQFHHRLGDLASASTLLRIAMADHSDDAGLF